MANQAGVGIVLKGAVGQLGAESRLGVEVFRYHQMSIPSRRIPIYLSVVWLFSEHCDSARRKAENVENTTLRIEVASRTPFKHRRPPKTSLYI
jgi:hypothetical protein